MTLDSRFRVALLLTAQISLMAFAASEQSLGLFVLVVVAAGAGWWVTEGQGASWKGLPRWLSSVTLLAMLIVAVVRALEGQREVVSAFTGFLASIIVVKLWEKRELRDYAQILTMSLFMTVGATLNNNTLEIGVLLVVQLPVFVVAVMLFQLFTARERVRELSWQGRAAGPQAGGVTWQAVRRAFLGVSIASVLAGGLISVLVFVLVPRGIGLQEWGDFARPRNTQATGFNEEVELSAGQVSQSQVAVMEVRFEGAEQQVFGGPDQTYYLRGAVLDTFDGQKWKRSGVQQNRGFDITSLEAGTELRLMWNESGGTEIRQKVTVLEGVTGDTPIFAMYRPRSVMLAPGQQAEVVTLDRGTGWAMRKGDGSRVTYTVVSLIDPESLGVMERRAGTSFPSARVQALAAGLLEQAGLEPDPSRRPITDDGRASRVLETYLRDKYQYTLTPGPPPMGTSATEYFLFDSKRGYCEYFASALAAMCRSVGIESRVIAGYLANEFHADSESYTVRASDAHAWVEVNTGPGGWQRRDATPSEGLREVKDARYSVWASIERLFASVQDLWNSGVVMFDQTAQERLLGQEGSQRPLLEQGAELTRHWRRALRRAGGAPGVWAACAMFVGAGFLIGGLSWVGLRAVGRRRTVVAGGGWAMVGIERRAYRELLSVMAKRGFPKPAWLPPMHHLRVVAARDAAFADGAGEVVTLLYRARFGGGGGADIGVARDRLRALRADHPVNGRGKV